MRNIATAVVCEWRPADSLARAKYAGCPALAVDGKSYCAAHYALLCGVRPPPKIDRTEFQDADLLPLTKEEFAALAELRERSK
jgi:hypothetical protein